MAAAMLGLLAAPAVASPPTEGFITTPDGVRLYYRKVGDSPDVVILPGRLFAFSDFEWLGRDYTLISYDMRNRGRSELVADDSKISFEHDVADLETVRRHFGVERIVQLGPVAPGAIEVTDDPRLR